MTCCLFWLTDGWKACLDLRGVAFGKVHSFSDDNESLGGDEDTASAALLFQTAVEKNVSANSTNFALIWKVFQEMKT